MSYQRLAYDDQDSAHQMHDDCTACSSSMDLPRPRVDLEAAARPAPALTYAEFEQQDAKPSIEVSDAAAHLASRLHLHLD